MTPASDHRSTTARAAIPTSLDKAIDTGLFAMAVGRVAGGALSRATPGVAAQFFGAGGERSPELDYVIRLCGNRAVTLGVGYLSTTGDARRRWQQLAFLCDTSDTLACIGDLVRGEIPRRTAFGAAVRTGIFAAIGAARIVHDRGTARRALDAPPVTQPLS